MMKNKYKKQRPHTPAWLDTLILWMEVLGVLGTIAAGIYALVTMLG